MAEHGLTLDLRLPPDPAVVGAVWAAAGIRHPTPEVCRMLLLAQLAAPLDEAGWHATALLFGSALEAVAPERPATTAEAEAEPAEAVAFAQMAAAFAPEHRAEEEPDLLGASPRLHVSEHIAYIWPDGKLCLRDGTVVDPADLQPEAASVEDPIIPDLDLRLRRVMTGLPPELDASADPEPIRGIDLPELPDAGVQSGWYRHETWPAVMSALASGEDAPADPEPILIEDDDAPAEGGVPPEPEPVAEAAAEPEVAQAEPGAEVAPEPVAAPVEPEPGPEPESMSRVGMLGEVLAEALAKAEDSEAVQALEDGESWTAQQDLKLATLVFSGKGMAHASREMGRSKADCIKRYNELMPRQGSAAQQALVKRLRAQVEAEARHGA